MIRPLDSSDASVVHALLTRPEVARWAGTTPYDAPAVVQKRLEKPASRFGSFEGGRLVALVELVARTPARCAHVGRLRVCAATPDEAAPALDAAIDTADRWLALTKLEVEIDAESPLRELIESRGFAREVTLRLDRMRDGALRDALVLGRLRPGFDPPSVGVRGRPVWPPRRAPRGDLTLRPASVDDAPAYAATMNEETAMWGTLQTPDGTVERWRRILATNDRIGAHAIVAERAGEIVGNAGVFRSVHPHDHVAWLGMTVARDAQGTGVGRALLMAIVEQAEQWLGVRRLVLEVYTDNDRAKALYLSTGFEPEGVRRAGAFRDGAYADCLVMARVRA